MNHTWSFDTHGDPLGSVRLLIGEIWQEAGLAGMLVTMDVGGDLKAVPRFIPDPALLSEINPFRPLMEMNIARLVPSTLANHPNQRIGVLLRPCEMRAFIEMTKHTAIEHANVLTISVDCLGTLPADEYQWRLERFSKRDVENKLSKDDPDELLSVEALRFARQGGIIPYRYRPACQVCISPEADYADININILGLPVRQRILISVPDPQGFLELKLDKLADRAGDERLQADHERVVAKMRERHARTIERINQGLGSLLPTNVDELITQLETCGDCQTCLDVCPICSVDRPTRDMEGHYEKSSVMRWLVSCAGCGMCEQACPKTLPISALFSHIRQQLDEEWQYLPGRSMNDRLPEIIKGESL